MFSGGQLFVWIFREFTGQDSLLKSDVSFMYDSNLDKHYVSLNLRVSKTDPYHQGYCFVVCAPNGTLCPYWDMQCE